jgi:hypothetical protein
MEKSILHIKLMDRPRAGQCQGEDHPNSGWLDNWTKCLIIINPRALCETTEDPASLVAVKRAIRLELVTENPLASDEVDTRGAGHQCPGLIAQ